MSHTTLAPKAAAIKLLARESKPARAIIAGFATTIFLSAFMLFQVQPLLSKFILPWFGGSPSVWTGAMLFFQLVLFGGYLYAHLLSTRCNRNQRLVIHLSLLALAAINVAWGKLSPPDWLRPQGLEGESPLLQVLLLLGSTVGLPYFALSSTGPLLQKWFHDALPDASPYRLFALSNLGSLVALISYPFFFEIQWGVVTQAHIWSVGYLVFVAGCAYCAVRAWEAGRIASLAKVFAKQEGEPQQSTASGNTSLRRMMAYWLGLSALASVMFLAVTNEVCQNVASVPLLWVVPLSLYLLSFIVAFDHPRWYSPQVFAWGVLLLLALVTHYDFCIEHFENALNSLLTRTGDQAIALSSLWWLQAACYFLLLFLIATLCHGELARSRPEPENLTTFYLTMSLGGAVGGLFVNLAAPHLFLTFWEFPLGLLLTACTATALALVAAQKVEQTGRRWAVMGLSVTLGLLTLTGLTLDQFSQPNPANRTEFESRNFYGIVTVMRRAVGDPDENFTFYSGSIQHGRQLADPTRRRLPLTYYGEGSGCSVAIKYVQSRSPVCRIGVVGLGVGTIATFARPPDTIRFYEINPEVMRIAGDTRWFHYLSDCRCRPELVLGDARLQMERELKKEGSQKFDVLVVDAFSGDSVPTHLLTREAFAVYTQHLQPDGILVINITNTHLDLYPVVSKLADDLKIGHRRIYKVSDTERMLNRNYYFVMSRDAVFLQKNPDQINDLPEYLRRPREVPMWTDDYTNLTSLLR